MEYYFSKKISSSYEEAIRRVTEALKSEGFGIVSEIKMHEKFKEKLGIDFRRYTILELAIHPLPLKHYKLRIKLVRCFHVML